MPRAKTTKLYRTFVKGLITEAGYLTYPEDASSSELNTILSRKGNRTRRLGINYEDTYTIHPADINSETAVSEHVWKSVDNEPLTFLVVQIGTIVSFYVLDSAPVSDNKAPFTVNLDTYKTGGSSTSDVQSNRCQFASGNGFLYIVHPFTEPLLVDYSATTNTIEVTPIIIQVRDFEGIYDGLANDQEPTELTPEHHYNLANQGWTTPGTQGVPMPGTTQPSYTDPQTGTTTTYDPNSGGTFEPNNPNEVEP